MGGLGDEHAPEEVAHASRAPEPGEDDEAPMVLAEREMPAPLPSIPVPAAGPERRRPDPPGERAEGVPGLAPPTPEDAAEAAESTGGARDGAEVAELRFEIREGDSLFTLFQARGLSQRDLHGIVSSDERVTERLSALRPGDRLRIRADGAAGVLSLSHLRGGIDALDVERQADGHYAARWTATAPPAPFPGKHAAAAPAADPVRTPAAALAAQDWTRHEVEVTSGDSLYGIFIEEDFSVGELVDLLRSGDEARHLKRLLPGQKLDFYHDDQRSVQHLVYHLDGMQLLHFFRTSGGFASARVEAELDRRIAGSSGEIRDSFYLSAKRAGLSDRLVMEVAEIFAWDVDFALDVWEGDRFSVIYEELYQPDGTASDGAILAAEFVNRGHRIRALRYEDEQGRAGYYSPDGFSLRKAFLRTPVAFTRISSGFGPRTHPLLHRLLQHNGVDYAAPLGTPVKATGDGVVVHVGRKGGYGKTVVLKHGALYTTVYAHLSRYASELGRGDPVHQGQVIGYVGSTGLATGPHLHYEFRVRGQHRDPLKVSLPKAAPIAQEYRTDFFHRTRTLVTRLDNLSTTQLAYSD